MDIKQFYDVNKRTQTEQVLKNQEDIDGLKDKDTDIEQAIDDEANARVQADESLAYDIADLQNQINSFGNVFTLKGSVATYGDLPATDNHIGDVWYVEADAVGYVWIDDNGTERWEQLGLPIDLSDYITTSDLALALEDYQEKLTAGTNISIIDNVISATGGSNNAVLLDNSTQEFDDSKDLNLKNGKYLNIGNENRGRIRMLPYNSSFFAVELGLENTNGGYRNCGIRGLSNKMQLFTGSYSVDVPNANGTLALTSDIKKYYTHNIYLRLSSAFLNISIINNSATPITTFAELFNSLDALCIIKKQGDFWERLFDNLSMFDKASGNKNLFSRCINSFSSDNVKDSDSGERLTTAQKLIFHFILYYCITKKSCNIKAKNFINTKHT